MSPHLVIIDGPLRGERVSLEDSPVTIGRDTSNLVSLDDVLVSRHHAIVEQMDEGYRIKDLDSRNGLSVNDVPVTERLLEDGDRIRIGRSTVLFLHGADEGDHPGGAVDVHSTGLPRGPLVQLKPEDTVYFRPEEIGASLHGDGSRMARDLSALLGIGTEINSCSDLETLGRLLVGRIAESVPAERIAILLHDERYDEFEPFLGWDRAKGFDQVVRLSQTIVEYVQLEGVAVLAKDVAEHELFGGVESLVDTGVRSVLAVPLVAREGTQGILYLESGEGGVRFDERDLQFVTAVAGIGAVAIENVRRVEWLEGEAERLRAEIAVEHDMVGESERMRDVFHFIGRISQTESTVLIRGESGTGKELVARAIHRNSSRKTKPFVAINCAALSETLLESELFGHEKGAFTGAIAQRKGKLEVADGGTLFLDEVGEMAPQLQAKLLRALQEREFERVGGTRPIKVDIRLVAATNRNLEEAVAAGSFRQDLYYRLNVVSLVTPPLRERREDIPLLARYYIQKFAPRCNRRVVGLSAEARACLMGYDWPGNVRELQNAIERAVALGSTEQILPEDLPEFVLETRLPESVAVGNYHAAIAKAKTQLILDALAKTNGRYSEAAKLLGLHRNYLHRLIRNLNITAGKDEGE